MGGRGGGILSGNEVRHRVRGSLGAHALGVSSMGTVDDTAKRSADGIGAAWGRARHHCEMSVRRRLRLVGPGVGQVRAGAVDGLGHVAQMLLGVVDVDDFDGAGELFGRQVPDPGGAVAKDNPAGRGVETAPLRLAMDALRKGGRLRVGVAAARALDRGVVADRPRGRGEAGPAGHALRPSTRSPA